MTGITTRVPKTRMTLLQERIYSGENTAERPRSAARPAPGRYPLPKANRRAGSAGAACSAMLSLREHQVHHPTATDVRAGTAAVREDVIVVAASVLEGVGQNRHRGEVPRLVHLSGEGDHGGC